MRPAFHRAAVAAFELAFAPVRRLLLHGPRMAASGTGLDSGRPILLIANHPSWWDGFLLRDVQRRIRPDAPLYTLMTERELARHPYLRWMGCVGMTPGRPGSVVRAIRALQRARARNPRSVFAFFPQGTIRPSSHRPLGFERGVGLLVERLAPIVLLPIGIHIEPLNRAAPTAFVAAGDPIAHRSGRPDVADLERAVAEPLDRIRAFLDRHGEAAGTLPFEPRTP